jgi:glycosyltransferase involved in cell wall biosynthesis
MLPFPGILFLDQYGSVYGAQRLLFELVKSYLEDGVPVMVAAPGGGALEDKINSSSAPFISLSEKSTHGVGFFGVLMKSIQSLILDYRLISISLAKQKGIYSVAYCNGLRVLPLAMVISFIKRMTLIVHVHLCFTNSIIKVMLRVLSRIRKVNIIFVSEAARAHVFPNRIPKRSFVIHNWVNKNILNQGKQLLEGKIAAFQDSAELNIAYVGRVSFVKGTHVFIDSLIKLLKDGENITATIAGDIGHELSESEYLKKLQQKVVNEGFADRIHFVGAVDDVFTIYEKANMVVIPSLCVESFGLVAVEAMATGCVIVASRIGGLAEIVKEQETGFLFAPGKTDELTGLIIKCMTDRKTCSEIIRKAQAAVETRFNPAIQIERIKAVKRDLKSVIHH